MHCIFNIFESAGGLAIGDFSCVTEIYKGGNCIFNIFESAGGLAIGDFRCVTEIYKGRCYGNWILDFIAKIAQNWP